MTTYTVIANDGATANIKCDSLFEMEERVVKWLYLFDDGSSFEIKHNDNLVSKVTRDRNAKHWKHDGFKFER